MKVYIGNYQNIYICGDTDKRNVVSYMEDIRGLKKSQYNIDCVDACDHVRSERYFLEELNDGYILPRRDCEQIRRDYNTYLINLTDATFLLTHYRDLLRSFAKSTSEWRTIESTIEIIEKGFAKPKRSKKIEKAFIATSSLLLLPIEGYIKFILDDEEFERQLRQFRNNILDDK